MTGSPGASSHARILLGNLEPGTYKVDVQGVGFQGYEQTGITLQAGQPRTVNVPLVVGSATTKVNVTAEAPLVDTRSQTVSTAITPQLTEQLPLNGRNILQLVSLAPDVAAANPSGSVSFQQFTRPDSRAALVVTSNPRDNSTAYYLDGGSNEDTYTLAPNAFPNPDAVQEFTIDSNSYNVKYGGKGGGVVNAVTRGGTNQFHGSAFEYLRNGAVNARNFFSPVDDKLQRNQFGFSLGGPIQKNKTFAFGSYQRTTLRYGTTSSFAFTATPAELGKNPDGSDHLCPTDPTQICGDWSAISQQLVRPPIFGAAAGQAFPGNQVPISLYDPRSVQFLQYIQPGDPTTGRFNYPSGTITNDDQWTIRVDRNFGEKWRVSGIFLKDTYAIEPTPWDPNFAPECCPFTTQQPGIHATLNVTTNLRPNLISTFGVSLSRSASNIQGSQNNLPSNNELGANWAPWAPEEHQIMGRVDGWFFVRHGGLYYRAGLNTIDINNNWTYVRGNHTLDIGGEVTLFQNVNGQAFLESGYAASGDALSGYSPLDFMLGQNSFFEQFGPPYQAQRGHAVALYVNDTWRVKPGLTLNLGVRWDPWIPWVDQSQGKLGAIFSQSAFNAGTTSTRYPNLPPGYLIRGDPGVRDGLMPTNWHLFDPRIGFAWDVRGDGKTSIRAGIGTYHDRPYGILYNNFGSNSPFVTSAVVTDTTVNFWDPYQAAPFNGVIPTLQTPPPSSSVFPEPLSTVMGFDPNFKPPATVQWNATVEHHLGQGFLLRGSYQASQSWHMWDSREINSAVYIPGNDSSGNPLSTSANIQQRRPFNPFFSGFTFNEGQATASFNSAIISVEKRMTGSLSLLGGYRWSRCMDESASGATTSGSQFTNPKDIFFDRGRCNSDVAHQITMATVYRLPQFLNMGFLGRNILGGWTMTGILVWRDGFPFSVSSGRDTDLDGVGNNRADLVGDPDLSGGRSLNEKLNNWFNTSAFATLCRWYSRYFNPKFRSRTGFLQPGLLDNQVVFHSLRTF